MEHKKRHLAIDITCLGIMVVGLVGLMISNYLIALLIPVGLIGMQVNEKLNPYNLKCKDGN